MLQIRKHHSTAKDKSFLEHYEYENIERQKKQWTNKRKTNKKNMAHTVQITTVFYVLSLSLSDL